MAQPIGAGGTEAGAAPTDGTADAMLNAITAGVNHLLDQGEGEEEEDDGVDGDLVAAIHQALNE